MMEPEELLEKWAAFLLERSIWKLPVKDPFLARLLAPPLLLLPMPLWESILLIFFLIYLFLSYIFSLIYSSSFYYRVDDIKLVFRSCYCSK